eukprot:1159831-Pelagomonas_calceolata.AAC.17
MDLKGWRKEGEVKGGEGRGGKRMGQNRTGQGRRGQEKGGREGRDIGAVELAQAVEALGTGEILLNCIDCDGAKQF